MPHLSSALALTALLFSACTKVDPSFDASADQDGDGYNQVTDCDDLNADIHPGATETCDGVDNNCNGTIDDAAVDALEWFVDVDGDGFAGTPLPTLSCEAPNGAQAEPTDCGDLDAMRYPGAEERCNGIDDDCDGELDEDAGDRVAFYADADGDGSGDPEAMVMACAAPPDHVQTDDDCDDTDAQVAPGLPERCGPVDDDCDGLVDAADPDLDVSTGTAFYLDRDGDGFGTELFPVFACELPTGAAIEAGDCDDLSARVNPGATEVCNERDDDCDGLVDDADDSRDAATGTTFYADTDGDGYGDAAATTMSCDLPTGYAMDATDCDDSQSSIAPGVREVCNGFDDDCDGRVDDDDPTLDATSATRWWSDRDGDGHGGRWFSLVACEQPDGLSADGDDCDDDNPDVSPSATEVCDGRDNDCDLLVDDLDDSLDTSTGQPWHPDEDGDGWGASDELVMACEAPEGFGQDTSDCDDSNPDISPDAEEICNGIDDDCDTRIDDSDDSLTSTGASYWRDADGDGWGTPAEWACQDFGFGWAAVTGDCDDDRSSVNPDATEICDNRDNDCDNEVDEDPTDATTWFVDADRDSWGSDETIVACNQPSGAASRSGDCDDGRNNVYPGRTEVCDQVDNNCNGTIDLDTPNLPSWYIDADGDTYGLPGSGVPACATFDDRISRAGDCDDTRPEVNPGQTEIDNNDLDDDCNGQTDFPSVIPGRVVTDDTTWGFDDSPEPFNESLIEVEGNILIAEGATLTIAPCTQILFAEGRALQVEGTLIARGSEDCRIQFTSRSLTPSRGDWGRVIFTATSEGAVLDANGEYQSGSILEYVDVLWSGSVSPAAVRIDSSNGGPVLRDVRISDSSSQSLYATAQLPLVEDCVFERSGGDGTYIGNATLVRNNAWLDNDGRGGRVYLGSGGVFTGNLVRDNAREGLSLRTSTDGVVTDNDIIDNARTGLEMQSVPALFSGNRILHNQPGMELYLDRDPLMLEGNVFAYNRGHGLTINSYACCGDGAPEPVEYNSFIANTGGLYYRSSAGATIRYNLFQGKTQPTAGVALNLNGSAQEDMIFQYNAFVGDQVEPWFDVGAPSGSPFMDVTDNYWNGRTDPGPAINDFLVDPSRTVAVYDPVIVEIPTDVPMSYPEGLDAVAAGGVVTLTWDANIEPDLGGYRVWYGLSDNDDWNLMGTGASEGDSGFSVSGETATVSGLDLTLPWRFSVSAVDTEADGTDDVTEGHESWVSPIVIP